MSERYRLTGEFRAPKKGESYLYWLKDINQWGAKSANGMEEGWCIILEPSFPPAPQDRIAHLERERDQLRRELEDKSQKLADADARVAKLEQHWKNLADLYGWRGELVL